MASFGSQYHVVKREGGFELLEGAGTEGGKWAVRGRDETKSFNSRREAEDHLNANLTALKLDSCLSRIDAISVRFDNFKKRRSDAMSKGDVDRQMPEPKTLSEA